MILLREVSESDLDSLLHLSQIAVEKHPGLFNLSIDQEQWKERIKRSIESFSEKIANKMDAKYVFLAEDLSKSPTSVVGISMIAAQHGTPEIPHFYFEVGAEHKFSKTINTGFIHGTLKLRWDLDGPSEIGGLLVDPQIRNSDERVGRQISFVRFLYLGMHKSKFKRRVLAELLPPLTKKGKSPLWEAVGRRFTNMDYTEADMLSSKNKEFILSLFPSGKIYTTFLPAEARNSIGKVSKDTEPVLHMLQKIGFQYRNQVDPFDGGPHVSAAVDEIVPIRNMQTNVYSGESFEKNETSANSDHITEKNGLVTLKNPSHELKGFRAVSVKAKFVANKVFFPLERADTIGAKLGDSVVFMPYY